MNKCQTNEWMSTLKCPFVHKGRPTFLFTWPHRQQQWVGDTLSTLCERKVIPRGITGNQGDADAASCWKSDESWESPYRKGRTHSQEASQVVIPKMGGLSSPKLWPRNQHQMRVCLGKDASPNLVTRDSSYQEAGAEKGRRDFPWLQKKASVERAAGSISPSSWEGWENSLGRDQEMEVASCHKTAVMTWQSTYQCSRLGGVSSCLTRNAVWGEWEALVRHPWVWSPGCGVPLAKLFYLSVSLTLRDALYTT